MRCEHNAAAVRRPDRLAIVGCIKGKPRQTIACKIHEPDIGVVLSCSTHRNSALVRREFWILKPIAVGLADYANGFARPVKPGQLTPCEAGRAVSDTVGAG